MTDLAPMPDDRLPTEGAAQAERRALTCHAPIGKVVVLVNPMSGGVGANAAADVAELLNGFACESEVVSLEGEGMDQTIETVLAGGRPQGRRAKDGGAIEGVPLDLSAGNILGLAVFKDKP